MATYEALVRERNALAGEYNALTQELRAGTTATAASEAHFDGIWDEPGTRRHRHRSPVLVPDDHQGPVREQRRELGRTIDRLDREAQELYRQIRDTLSPGTVLRNVLNDGQGHGVGIRQGAAWGLYRLLRDGHLDASAARELRQALVTLLNDDAPLRERRVHLPAGCGRADLRCCLEDGLGWLRVMEQLRHAPLDDDTALKPPDSAAELARLTTLCDLAHRHLPGAVAFFQRHPLRLMNRADHQTLLGQYVANGAEVQLWYYYTPPEGTGKVHARCLQLENHSTPNSLGIDAALFRHELLALPVLYHEFLHYGGTTGDPGSGIANEMEVRFREMLFHRALVAELAPADDADLPDYEAALVAASRQADCACVLVDLLYDYGDDAELDQINEAVADTYGRPLPLALAQVEAVARLRRVNEHIYDANDELTWDPLVTWPLLHGDDELTQVYADILVRRKQQEHTLSPQRRDRILAEPASRDAVAGWAAYCQRPGALAVLRAEAERLRAEMDLAALYRLLVRRFPYLLRGEEPAPTQPSEPAVSDAG